MFHRFGLPFIALLSFAAFLCGVFFRGFDQPLFAPALLCVYGLGAMILLTGYRGGWSVPATAVAGFLAAFWVWLGVSLFWSDVPYISTIFVLIIGVLPMLFFTVTAHPERDCVIGALSVGVCAATAFLGLWAVVQFVFLGDLVGTRIAHPMLNPNNLAVLLVMAVFPLLGAVCLAPLRLKPVMAGIAIVLFAAAVMTQSRGGMVGLVTGLFLFIATGWPMIRRDWKYFLVISCSAALTSAVILWSIMLESGSAHLTGGGTAGQSIDVRFMLWDSGWRMLKDHLFTPIGLGNFYLVFPAYRHFGDVSDGYFLHVDPLQFAIETGMPVLILFYGFAVAVLLRTIRALRRPAEAGQRFAIAVPFCSLTALMVNAHLNFDLYMLPAILFGAVMLCAWYRATELLLPPQTIGVDFKTQKALAVLPVLLLVFVAGPIWLARAGYGVSQVERAGNYIAEDQMGPARRAIDNAHRFGPSSYYRGDYMDGLWQATRLRKLDKDDPSAGDVFLKAEAGFNSALANNPYYSHAMVQEALLNFLHNPGGAGRDKARDILEGALRIDPFSMDARIGLANILDTEGKTADAIQVLEEGYQWEAIRKYAPLAYRDALVKLYVKLGVDPAQIEKMKRDTYEATVRRQMQIKERQRLDLWISRGMERLLQRWASGADHSGQ